MRQTNRIPVAIGSSVPQCPIFSSDSKLDSFKFVVSGTGENKQSKILSQPVIDNNILFFLDAKSNVISFDLKNNKILWKKNISLKSEKNHNIGGGIVVYKSTIIVNSAYGQIISMDKLSGKLIWKINVESSIRSAPTVFDNKLLSLTLSNKLYVLNGDEVHSVDCRKSTVGEDD